MPDNLIKDTETSVLKAQTIQQATAVLGTMITDLINDGQDRLLTKIIKATPGGIPGHPLDQRHEPNHKTGVLVQMRMFIGPCQVLLKMLGLDVACKFPMFKNHCHAQRPRVFLL